MKLWQALVLFLEVKMGSYHRRIPDRPKRKSDIIQKIYTKELREEELRDEISEERSKRNMHGLRLNVFY